jgi:hypothetical protein
MQACSSRTISSSPSPKLPIEQSWCPLVYLPHFTTNEMHLLNLNGPLQFSYVLLSILPPSKAFGSINQLQRLEIPMLA